ncbi:MAG: hydrogenase formation protein HypD [Methanobacteriota archaeon]|nr:MAG: hydrogenase formation protein HypD [Euryarchaeota archaeon]
MYRFRDKDMGEKIIDKIKGLDQQLTLMHVCGTHQDTLVRYGLQGMLTDAGVDIRQGPGCPVCVTTPKEIEESILLAKSGMTILVFGDMLKVPGATSSLSQAKTEGSDVRIVYGVDDAVRLAGELDKDCVFMSIGFETTTPSSAAALKAGTPDNFHVLSCNRVIPPALKAIAEMGEIRLDGLIEPGHVSTVIGSRPYEFVSEQYGIPQVVAGFEPLDLLMGVYMLAKQKKNGESKVEIEYTRAVKRDGNPKAVEVMNSVFQVVDVKWRGFPVIPGSGLELREEYGSKNARIVFEEELSDLKGKEFPEPKGCLCGEVLRGIASSEECPLFGTGCTPDTPVGPCMVSTEGSCNIVYKYGKMS